MSIKYDSFIENQINEIKNKLSDRDCHKYFSVVSVEYDSGIYTVCIKNQLGTNFVALEEGYVDHGLKDIIESYRWLQLN